MRTGRPKQPLVLDPADPGETDVAGAAPQDRPARGGTARRSFFGLPRD